MAITTDELARVLHLRAPTADQLVAMQRVLDSADTEVTSYIARLDPLTAQQQQLVDEVTLERAVEHWQQQESPFGLMGLGGDNVPIYTARDSFDRHRLKLRSVKQQEGVA
jgi:hypothetical protein